MKEQDYINECERSPFADDIKRKISLLVELRVMERRVQHNINKTNYELDRLKHDQDKWIKNLVVSKK